MSLILRRKKLSLLLADFERWVPLQQHPDRGEKLYDCAWALLGFRQHLLRDIDALARLLAIEVRLRTCPGPGVHLATERILEVLITLAEPWSRDPDAGEPAPGAGEDRPPPETLPLLCRHAQEMLGWMALPRDMMAGRRRAVAWEILREAAPRGESIGLLPLAIRAVGHAGAEEAVCAADFALTWCNLASLPTPPGLDAALERLQKKKMRSSLQRRLRQLTGDDLW